MSHTPSMMWHDMSEAAPARPGKYLACFHDGEMGVIIWPGNWMKRSPLTTLIKCDITHWMELPARPKKGEA